MKYFDLLDAWDRHFRNNAWPTFKMCDTYRWKLATKPIPVDYDIVVVDEDGSELMVDGKKSIKQVKLPVSGIEVFYTDRDQVDLRALQVDYDLESASLPDPLRSVLKNPAFPKYCVHYRHFPKRISHDDRLKNMRVVGQQVAHQYVHGGVSRTNLVSDDKRYDYHMLCSVTRRDGAPVLVAAQFNWDKPDAPVGEHDAVLFLEPMSVRHKDNKSKHSEWGGWLRILYDLVFKSGWLEDIHDRYLIHAEDYRACVEGKVSIAKKVRRHR